MGSGFRAPAISPVLRFRESSHKTDYSSLARRPRRHLQTPQLGAVVARLDLWPARLRHDRGLFVELADQRRVVLRRLAAHGRARRRQPARLRVGELERPRVARALAAAAGRLAAVVARVEAARVPALHKLREELPRLLRSARPLPGRVPQQKMLSSSSAFTRAHKPEHRLRQRQQRGACAQ